MRRWQTTVVVAVNMQKQCHILINGLSMGSGGGFTVGRELSRHLALIRPEWKLTLAIIADHPLHQQIHSSQMPPNFHLLEAPPHTSRRAERSKWERHSLTGWAVEQHADAVLQLNGMVVPGMRPPTLCHMQDPWPYRPEAWDGWRDRIVAAMKRRSHRIALKQAAGFTWTSDYLRQLICSHHQIWPSLSEVVYNGVPADWIDRAARTADWQSRPNELITVSNVNRYKRQRLVIEALPELLRKPGLDNLLYRIVGEYPPGYDEDLKALAKRLGVSEHVRIEGRLPDAEVAALFERAKCFVLMSVCESFGIPAIEAMSFGTPVVVGDCCAIPEVCADAADLAPVDDARALADHIARVFLDPARAEALRTAGTQRVARFNWTAIAARVAKMLEEIILTRTASTP